MHARLGHWAAAASDLDAAFKLSPLFPDWLGLYFRRLQTDHPPSDRFDPERLILYHLRAGDLGGYRASCSSLRQLVPRDADPGVELFVVYLLTLGPDGSDDRAEPVRLAERAIAALTKEEAARAQRYLGAALYRAGRYAEAVPRLEENCHRGGRDGGPWDWAFLAMAHHRLGHASEARHWLDHFLAPRPEPARPAFSMT